MQNALKKKLNSNRGASMMLALALFLVCVMVSSVIITAAASNSSRNVLRTQRQRDYLAVSSAADMLAKELADVGQFVGFYETKTYGCQDFHSKSTKYFDGVKREGYEYQEDRIPDSMDAIMMGPHHPNVVNEGIDESEGATTIDGLFKELILRATAEVFLEGNAYEETITISLTEEDERLSPVTCYFVMDREYDMTFELTTASSPYAIVIKLDGTAGEPVKTEDSGFSCEHTVYYKEKQGDGTYADASKMETIEGTSEYVKTTVSWGPPVVTKGVGIE